ncbi:hypothetical protein [Staphylothermus hellenicus]|uniref:Uncharacterized protein n=1 Tax=Staphylothermus hellenicus (strain DSM 12710 / JCM 10830 / BK20S6-10-b1 / P8) TaxID=591019 RepID=D7DBB7_STAHD|nr:hypothetical protein [Staphylothermus hellenicus]ADI31464.1 hypothetical protein Shell_0332 [Staphylothermus hellenicus DSM 12710]
MQSTFLLLSTLFLVPLALISGIVSSFNNLQTITGEIRYLVIVDGARSDNPLDMVSFQCVISLKIENNKVESISASNFIINNIPDSVSYRFQEFVKTVIIKWFNSFSLFDKVESNYKTYISVNGKIIEAYIVSGNNGVEYREANTGLYVGGDKELQISIETISPMHPKYRYNLSIISYLFSIKPEQIINSLAVIEPPTSIVRNTTIIIAATITVLAVRTLMKWKDYSIM